MKLENIIAKRSHKTIYRDDSLAIKVFDCDYSKADVLNEALNHARVEETSLSIPSLHEVSMLDGKWAIVSDYIEGKTLDVLIKENPDKKEEYLTFFVNLQLQVHKQSCPLLGRLQDKMHRKISLGDYDATTRYELHTRLSGMKKHSKLCHGDFNPKNIIVKEDGTAYIIDWAHATQGNASADAAKTYLLFMLKGNKDFAEAYLDTFCKLSDIAKQYVQQWIPIVAASQSLEAKPEEVALLKTWVNVMDFQ